jgi:hypothetical protein
MGADAGREPPDALTGSVSLLCAEIDTALSSDRWAFVRNWGVLSRAYAGAALRHCAVLLEEMDAARGAGREATVRVLLRAHVETWVIGMYLALGGDESLDAAAADYLATMNRWDRSLTAYNEKTRKARERAERRNARIRSDNEGKARWNASHPDLPPRPLVAEVPVPLRQPVEFDLAPALLGAQTDVPPKELKLSNVAARVDRLLDAADDDLTVEAAYEVVYRALSTFATHATLPLLDSYLPRDQGYYIRVAREAGNQPVGESFSRNALVLTAMLARRVLSMNDTPAPVAAAIERLAREPALRADEPPNEEASGEAAPKGAAKRPGTGGCE